jgi:filamentous hemagglutinin family protein
MQIAIRDYLGLDFTFVPGESNVNVLFSLYQRALDKKAELPDPADYLMPKNGQAVSGTVVIAQDAGNTVITQTSERSVINWQSFDIGENLYVWHDMPDANSYGLHRVIGGGGASQLLGNLSSNGNLYLVNPAGMILHNGAKVDVGGFVFSTTGMPDERFLAGYSNPIFSVTGTGGDPEVSIVLAGSVKGGQGPVNFFAPSFRLESTGSIEGSDVWINADFSIDLRGRIEADPYLRVEAGIHPNLPGGKVSIDGNVKGETLYVSASDLMYLRGAVTANNRLELDGQKITIAGGTKSAPTVLADSLLFKQGDFSIGQYAVKAREVEVNGDFVTLQGNSTDSRIPHIFDVETFTDRQNSDNVETWQIVVHDKDGKVIDLSRLKPYGIGTNWEDPVNQVAFLKEYEALSCVFEVFSCAGSFWDSGYSSSELRQRFNAAIQDILSTTQNNDVTQTSSGQRVEFERNLSRLLEAHRAALRNNRINFIRAWREAENEFYGVTYWPYWPGEFDDDKELQAGYRNATKAIFATMKAAGLSIPPTVPSMDDFRRALELLIIINALGPREITVEKPSCPLGDLLCINFYLRFIENLSAPESFYIISSLAKNPESGWFLMDPADAVFHQNGDDYPEFKYVNEITGQEVVFDGKTYEVITDVRIAGSYNYGATIERYSSASIGHFLKDMLPYAIMGTVPGYDDLYANRAFEGYSAILLYANLIRNKGLNSGKQDDAEAKQKAIDAFASKDVQIAFGFRNEDVDVPLFGPGRGFLIAGFDPVEYFKELSSTFAEIVELDIKFDSYHPDKTATLEANRKSYLSSVQGIVRDFQQSHLDPMLQHPLFMLLQNIGIRFNFDGNLPAPHVATRVTRNVFDTNTPQSREAKSALNTDKYIQESQAEIEAFAEESEESNEANGECAKDESGEDCKTSL